jgi:hypothetical protein
MCLRANPKDVVATRRKRGAELLTLLRWKINLYLGGRGSFWRWRPRSGGCARSKNGSGGERRRPGGQTGGERRPGGGRAEICESGRRTGRRPTGGEPPGFDLRVTVGQQGSPPLDPFFPWVDSLRTVGRTKERSDFGNGPTRPLRRTKKNRKRVAAAERGGGGNG